LVWVGVIDYYGGRGCGGMVCSNWGGGGGGGDGGCKLCCCEGVERGFGDLVDCVTVQRVGC